MFIAATAAIVATMALALVRALLGPSVYDRVLAVNMLGTKTVLLLAVASFALGRPEFVDLALAYALINFIGVLAVLEFFFDRKSRQIQEPAHKLAPKLSRELAPERLATRDDEA